MRLTRVYVPMTLETGAALELPPEAASHVAKVLRARVGDSLILFNGDGREFGAEIDSIRGSRVSASVGQADLVDRESTLAVTLVQAVPRGDRMDFIVQKATELGVSRIVPTMSQRSVVRLDARQGETKAAHWRAVAVSACEQCGRNRLPAVDEPRPLIDYLGAVSGAATRLVLEPDADDGSARPEFSGDVEIAIGPEGGFAPDELEAFRIAGFLRMRLGPRILRTETAAIAALTWLQTQFGDMRQGS
ncbi:MAG: 16S rRNA (uracil(1498)-N(3))-methyltransferase [Steroidobacteraceae bacterium]|jgi:16S rRNA (uracil1498-N3)-methyltransferase